MEEDRMEKFTHRVQQMRKEKRRKVSFILYSALSKSFSFHNLIVSKDHLVKARLLNTLKM